jgi:predicted metalloendopeptidase
MRNIVIVVLVGLAACSKPAPVSPPATAQPAAPAGPVAGTTPGPTAGPTTLASGVDTEYVDAAVRPQDDTYRHLNGKWLDTFQIPPDRGIYVSFTQVADRTDDQLHELVDGLAGATADTDPDARKLADVYASFMDEAKLESLALQPLMPDFAAVDAMKSKKDIPALIAHLNQSGADAPYDLDIYQDKRDSTRYAVNIGQSGLGMPDRDYYLKPDAKLAAVRAKYLEHVGKMLSLAGDRQAAAHAASILALEKSLAEIQWTKVQNRDPVKTYNKMTLADLAKLMPGYDWKAWMAGAGLAGRADYVIINQPGYFTAFAHLLAKTPLPVWKEYFKWQVLSAAAPYLSKAFVDESFAFRGVALRGVPENRPRWKRGVMLLDGSMGEALGKLYVAKYFPPQNKARMEALVHNLIEAYRRDIETLDWMGPETRKGAQLKLAKLAVKIAYPKTWRDYGSLKTSPDDLWGNVLRATQFEYRRNVDKLGKPIDRDEWDMAPQTVNAYYQPLMNEVVFPAAILQPPFFDVRADDAVNYGAIGAIIGHELSHGFDDKGSQYDADGNLHDWFTAEDHAKFAAKTKALVAQYAAYEPVPGFHVNGELTLGENIADNSGLAIAYKAYDISLGGKPAAMIDGLTGAQRLFYGYVQGWRGKSRENEAIMRIKTDPHSPPSVRGTVPLMNLAAFDEAFDVKPGDKMYLAPEQRVTIW